ncbi:DUF423 domain-containing protein [Flavobacteriaceae sp. LMIT009]
MNKYLLIAGTLFGGLAVVLGAFAAHGLEKLITPDQIETFETGVRYQMYHAFLLLIVGCINMIDEKTKKTILWITVFGIILFSGSIYVLATNDLTSFDFKTIGFVTPLGGLLFIITWGILLFKFLKIKSE